MPFYKRLLAADGMDHKERRLIVLSLGGSVPVRDIWVKAGLKPSRITSDPMGALVREISDHAPELIVLDGPGKRLGIWRGWLDPPQEDEVLQLFLEKRD